MGLINTIKSTDQLMKKATNYTDGTIAWSLRTFPNIMEESGSISVVEYDQEFEFIVKRCFFIRDVVKGSTRGSHSHKELKQLILCLNGSFTIHLDNGTEKQSIIMKADNLCLFVDGRVWREMTDFSDNAVMAVLCDREYRFDEVIRDYSQFKKGVPSR